MTFEVAEAPLTRGTTLIEASAGTGKTYTIAGLFLRLIVEENLRVGQILVTTYTEAATAELRDRIRKLLRAALEAWTRGQSDDPLLRALLERGSVAPEIARQRLERALRAFDEAAIHTIHGFCQRVLQDRAFESGVLFDAELITDQSAFLREIAEDYWRLNFYEAAPLHVAAAMHGELTPAGLATLLRETISHAKLRVLPEESALFNLREELDSAFAELRARWPAWRDEVRSFFLTNNAWAKAQCAKPEVMEPLLALLDLCVTDPAAPVQAYAAFESFAPDFLAENCRARHSAPEHEFFTLCERIAEALARFGLAVESDFLTWARLELPQRKAQRNVVSFDDLLTRLHAALVGQPSRLPLQVGLPSRLSSVGQASRLPTPAGERLAELVRTRFPAALIDEFQDTDPVQEEIFRTIFNTPQNCLYLIGDPKQAIYAFRGADVFTYLGAARRADRGFKLGTNFRSTAALVTGVNTIFGQGPQPFVVPDIDFKPVQSSGKAAETPLRITGQARAPFRIWLPETDDSLGITDANDRLPGIVAGEISRLLDGRATLGDRPLVPPDIAVLTASNRQARAVQAALSAQGVPSVLLSNASVFESLEAAELHTLLAALAQPLREGLLRAALATRWLALTAVEIDALAGDEQGWEKWLLRFQLWNQEWRRRGFIPMFRTLLRECDVRPRLLGQPDGERALTNVLHLAELVHQAATEQRLSPVALVQWLADRRREKGVATEEYEVRLERDEDAVKVVTIHKSKGLEYNVVFCPFGWGKAELHKGERPLFHAEEGLTLDLGSEPAHEAAAAEEKLAEQTRLLYVALTRAKHECHFVWGRFPKNDVSAAMWLLHPPPPPPAADPIAALKARGAALTPERLRAEIEGLALGAPEAIAAVPWPDPGAPPYQPAAGEVAARQARQFRGAIQRDWRVSSFSSLTEHRETELPDYDRAPAAGESLETGAARTGIHAFPAGKTPGVCLHAIFEKLDFTKPGDVAPLVEQKLAAFGFHAAEWREPVAQCVRRVLDVELAPGLQLKMVSFSARLQEIEFYFPVARLTPATLSTLVGDPRLSFDPRRGLLKGYIDLVFEHSGRFYIADWKSNRLGPDATAYHQEALREAMARHHYGLQYHLYALALHRYLRLRLGVSYDYERHFGGVFYLFLRGVDPARPELGLFRDRPTAACIAQLDALFSDPA
ncbi:MAG: exodeoxyribonuclease beta subunit [Chthoniobacter sp.]|jgi:exodeoxyribonuclease V beta subunit|nr:exodeoxyribonuclease beta subunit [Chthoniobacter sp.]